MISGVRSPNGERNRAFAAAPQNAVRLVNCRGDAAATRCALQIMATAEAPLSDGVMRSVEVRGLAVATVTSGEQAEQPSAWQELCAQQDAAHAARSLATILPAAGMDVRVNVIGGDGDGATTLREEIVTRGGFVIEATGSIEFAEATHCKPMLEVAAR